MEFLIWIFLPGFFQTTSHKQPEKACSSLGVANIREGYLYLQCVVVLLLMEAAMQLRQRPWRFQVSSGMVGRVALPPLQSSRVGCLLGEIPESGTRTEKTASPHIHERPFPEGRRWKNDFAWQSVLKCCRVINIYDGFMKAYLDDSQHPMYRPLHSPVSPISPGLLELTFSISKVIPQVDDSW